MGGCDKICDFLFDDYQISKKVHKYKNKYKDLHLKNKDLTNKLNEKQEIINEQIGTIKKLTESDIELKQIKNSKSWKLIEKLRRLKK